MNERAVTFACAGCELLAIIHQPQLSTDTAVLIVVGGPQYRVGSHRQFVQLSRALANEGIGSLRFDYRGMGDSQGIKQNFDEICDDLTAAGDLLCKELGCKNFVIWGLCDAASAAMIYAHKDARIAGLILLNPWLKSEQAMGKTMIKHYYVQRLLSREFWQKLFSGKLKMIDSLSDAKNFVQDSVATQKAVQGSYQERMQKGVSLFSGPLCIILSGVDLTAKEFEEQAFSGNAWSRLKSKDTLVHRISQADHTFSKTELKRQVEQISIDFVQANSSSL
jgi:exosortase A-associated hydrolase 1